jgi:hypothetical protein
MIPALSQEAHKIRRFARQYNVFEDGPKREIGEVLQRFIARKETGLETLD